MRKYLLLLVLPFLMPFVTLRAQSLFSAPDTVCVRQAVTMNSRNDSASNYYWGFCSGSILNAPTGVNMGSTFSFHTPSAIDAVRDTDGKYYAFILNAGTDELIRLNYGTSLDNVPTVTNYGNLTNGLPHHPTSLYIIHDKPGAGYVAKWHIFITGGYTSAESRLARLDFGPTLANVTPNIANMGNLNGLFNGPRGIFVAKDEASSQYFGYVLNRNTNELLRLDFEFNISNTPIVVNAGNPGGVLNGPTDLAAIQDNGKWYLFTTNLLNNSVARLDLGTRLDTNTDSIQGNNMGDFLFRILQPSSISITRDCGGIYAYVTDSSTSQLIAIQMASAAGPYTSVDYSIVGRMNYPSGISSIIRDHDNIYAFICNSKDSSLTKVLISECGNSSIPSFREVTPPVIYYNDTGWYNVYYVINDGLPNMQVECKRIRVEPVPNLLININPVICRGDTIRLYAISNYADSFAWSPLYNLDTAYNHTDSVKAWPDVTTRYNLNIHYPDGCIIDTFVDVKVIKVIADAGPDRTIADGAATTLGGPNMSLDHVNGIYAGYGAYSYEWSPNQYINSDIYNPFPTVTLPFDYTYIVKVSVNYATRPGDAGLTCIAYDTVNIHVNCGDLYLPNAFNPNSDNQGSNKFGILNTQISQLNYFRIFDRWGKLVFETKTPSLWWDGTFNGTACPPDVYLWIADGFCESGRPVKKKGNVTLLR